MRRGLVLILAALLAQPASARSTRAEHGDSRIFSPDREVVLPDVKANFDHLPPPPPPRLHSEETMDWLVKANAVLAEIVMVLLSGFIPDRNGVERPLADENPLDQYVKRIGESNFQFVMQGVGNLKLLGGPYLYNELQGGVGIEYDFFRPEPNGEGTLIGIRVSPLYGEFVTIRLAAGAARVAEELPTRYFLGSAAGVELGHRRGRLEPGFRAYAKALHEMNGAKDNGVSYEGALYCKIHLIKPPADLLDPKGYSMYLKPTLNFYDRGGMKQDLYNWRPADNTVIDRGVGDIRRFWEALLYLEGRF